MTPISIAFLPLTDSAVLVAAREKGFAAEQGIDLNLVRSTSWATLRDRLVYGQVQAAHMLAPLAIAVTLGLSQHRAALAAPFKLNVNGNALTMSTAFAAALDPDLPRRIDDPMPPRTISRARSGCISASPSSAWCIVSPAMR